MGGKQDEREDWRIRMLCAVVVLALVAGIVIHALG